MAYLSGQGKVENKWTPVSQWLNITKVYFFSHYSSSVGDRHTTISWCCHLNRWFQGCQPQSWRWGHFSLPQPRRDMCSSVHHPFVQTSHVAPPTPKGQGESSLCSSDQLGSVHISWASYLYFFNKELFHQSHSWACIWRKLLIRKDTYTPVFIATLFTISKTCKQCKYPPTDEWIKKMRYVYTMTYYSAIKRMK